MALLQKEDVLNAIVEQYLNTPGNELLQKSFRGTFEKGTKYITLPYISKLTPVDRANFVPGATPKRMNGGTITKAVGEGLIEETALPIGNEFYQGGLEYAETMAMIQNSLDQFRFRYLLNSVMPTAVGSRLFKSTGTSGVNDFGATVKAFTLADLNTVIRALPYGDWYMVVGKKSNTNITDLIGDNLKSTMVGAEIATKGMVGIYKGVKIFEIEGEIPMTTTFTAIAGGNLKMEDSLYPNTTRSAILFIDASKLDYRISNTMPAEFKPYNAALGTASFGGAYDFIYMDKSINADGVFGLVQG